MKGDVSSSIEELKRQFNLSAVTVREDGQGGAYVVLEPVALGPKFRPETTWVGFHIPPQYPYADMYPVFIGANVGRADGVPFVLPTTPRHSPEGRPAIQGPRRNSAAQSG